VDTDEQDLGDVLGDHAFGLGQGPEPLAAVAVDEQGDEVDHPGTRHAVDRLVHIAFHGFEGKDAAELLGQRLDGAGEGLAGERVHGGVAEGHGPASLGHGGTGNSGLGGVSSGDLAAAGGPARRVIGDQAEGGGQPDQGAGLEPVVGPVAVAVGLHHPGLT
jgi:hypothetical protein